MRAPVREPNTRYELDPTRRGGGSGAALIYIISRIFLDTDILSFSYGKRDLALLRNFKSFSFLMQRFRGVFFVKGSVIGKIRRYMAAPERDRLSGP